MNQMSTANADGDSFIEFTEGWATDFEITENVNVVANVFDKDVPSWVQLDVNAFVSKTAEGAIRVGLPTVDTANWVNGGAGSARITFCTTRVSSPTCTRVRSSRGGRLVVHRLSQNEISARLCPPLDQRSRLQGRLCVPLVQDGPCHFAETRNGPDGWALADLLYWPLPGRYICDEGASWPPPLAAALAAPALATSALAAAAPPSPPPPLPSPPPPVPLSPPSPPPPPPSPAPPPSPPPPSPRRRRPRRPPPSYRVTRPHHRRPRRPRRPCRPAALAAAALASPRNRPAARRLRSARRRCPLPATQAAAGSAAAARRPDRRAAALLPQRRGGGLGLDGHLRLISVARRRGSCSCGTATRTPSPPHPHPRPCSPDPCPCPCPPPYPCA